MQEILYKFLICALYNTDNNLTVHCLAVDIKKVWAVTSIKNNSLFTLQFEYL